jgi:hypothetical protein
MTPDKGGRCTAGHCGVPKPKPSPNDIAAYNRLIKALQQYWKDQAEDAANVAKGQAGACTGSMPYGCGTPTHAINAARGPLQWWQKLLIAGGVALPVGLLCVPLFLECVSGGTTVAAGINASASGEGAAPSTALVRDADKWPLFRGFLGGYSEETHLKPGTLIDRYGSDYGTFFAPAGSSLPGRAMHPSALDGAYNVYRVTNKGLTVQGGLAQPYFGQPGLGIQYETSMNVKDLLAHGYIQRVPDGG